MITKSELEEKNRLVFNLQQQVDETRTESEYQLRLKDNKFAEEFKMAKKKSEAEIGELSQQITRLQTDMRNTGKAHEVEIGNAQEENEKAMVDMAEQYKSKLIVEYQKFDNLEEKYNNLKTTYESKMDCVQAVPRILVRSSRSCYWRIWLSLGIHGLCVPSPNPLHNCCPVHPEPPKCPHLCGIK